MDVIRTNATDPDFVELVAELDRELAERDGTEAGFYAQYNGLSAIKHVVLIYQDGVAVACGAIKDFNGERVEVKRMYTKPAYRGRGLASKLLNELETWASALSFRHVILETGKRQPEAIALYQKNGYQIIPNYGQYIGVENSLCFEKSLSN